MPVRIRATKLGRGGSGYRGTPGRQVDAKRCGRKRHRHRRQCLPAAPRRTDLKAMEKDYAPRKRLNE